MKRSTTLAAARGVTPAVMMTLALVLTLTLALALAGCSVAAGDEPAASPRPTPSTHAEAATVVTEPGWPTLPEGVLATGVFEGAARGAVQLLNLGDGMLTVHIDDLEVHMERYSGPTALPYHSFPDEGCDDPLIAWGFGWPEEDVVPRTYDGTFPLSAFEGDPSLIRELIIRDFAAPGGLDECLATPGAKAVLTWTYQPLRAGLEAVDTGVSGGARGEPILQDGAIVGYLVAVDDLIDEVSARFSMTASDLRYLNPDLGPVLRIGDTINLSMARR